MKNIVLSAVAVLAMSSFAVAGGDIAPVEEPVVVAEPIITDSGFYLGLAYGWMGATTDASFTTQDGNDVNVNMLDESFGSVMLQAGYKINEYIAIEGRYWIGLSTNLDYDGVYYNFGTDGSSTIDTWGIYVKPMYPVTDALDIYALLGYASSDVSTNYGNVDVDWGYDTDGFSWGLGVAYSFTDNVSIFVDYVNLYDDTNTVTNFDNSGIDVDFEDKYYSVNFGVNYKF